MILILTRPFDIHADKVIEALKARDIECFRLHPSEFPTNMEIEIGFCPNICHVKDLGGRIVDLDRVRTVWNRRPSAPDFPAEIGKDQLRFANAESTHVLRGLWYLLSKRFWVNPYDCSYVAQFKPYHLSVAQSVGFRVPRTLMTNSPERALEFVDACQGGIIYKTFTSYHESNASGTYRGIYTNLISRAQVIAGQKQIQVAPCIFQEYIQKRVEVRVTVIGSQVLAAEIDSQESARSRVDWRRYDFPNTPYRPHCLPNDVELMIRQLMLELGLVFGCIDLIVTPEGEYVFLEINPNGQWYWIELLTGLPLVAAFVELLISAGPQARQVIDSRSRIEAATYDLIASGSDKYAKP